MQDRNRNIFIAGSLLFAVVVMLSFTAGVSLANTDNVTVNVTIANQTEITVTPTVVSWDTGIYPGTVGGERNISVQNTGSSDARDLYAFMTTLENETAYPYLTTNSDLYSAGGVLVFRNETAVSTVKSWAGRLEWNWTEKISATLWTGFTNPQSVRAEGFIRNVTKQFYWAAANGSNDAGNPATGYCNNSEAELAIDFDEDNGTVTTRTPAITSITRNAGDANWSYFSVDTGYLSGQCIALYVNCTKIYIYNFDKRTTTAFSGSSCTNSDWLTRGPIAPGAIERPTADIWVPKGIPAGALRTATWTFVVTG